MEHPSGHVDRTPLNTNTSSCMEHPSGHPCRQNTGSTQILPVNSKTPRFGLGRWGENGEVGFLLPPSPPALIEVIPPPVFCEFTDLRKSGKDCPPDNSCIPGIFVCPNHLNVCGGPSFSACCFCERILCFFHEDCFCAVLKHQTP